MISSLRSRKYTGRFKKNYQHSVRKLCLIKEWHNTVSNQPTLEYYCMFKTDFKYEIYRRYYECKIEKTIIKI